MTEQVSLSLSKKFQFKSIVILIFVSQYMVSVFSVSLRCSFYCWCYIHCVLEHSKYAYMLCGLFVYCVGYMLFCVGAGLCFVVWRLSLCMAVALLFVCFVL